MANVDIKSRFSDDDKADSIKILSSGHVGVGIADDHPSTHVRGVKTSTVVCKRTGYSMTCNSGLHLHTGLTTETTQKSRSSSNSDHDDEDLKYLGN